MTSGCRRRNHNCRAARLQLEALEARDLPSAGALGLSVPGDQPAATVALDIVGTGITFDQRGLPASLTGNIYVGTQPQGPVLGQYVEALTPLIINGLFIGTIGQATFNFFPGSVNNQPLATIHTLDLSFIQGIVPPSNALFVSSAGTISGSSGAVGQIEGGFTSSSLVVFGPPFASDTLLEFTVTPE